MSDYEERSIVFESAFLCADHAIEYLDRDFRTPAFDRWLDELLESSQPLMRHWLDRSEDPAGALRCSACRTAGVDKPAAYSIELQIDGDG